MTDIIEEPTPKEAASFDAEAAEAEQAAELGLEGAIEETTAEVSETSEEATSEEEVANSPEKRSAGFFESAWEGIKKHPVYSAFAAYEGLVTTPMLIHMANKQFTGQNPLETVYHVLSRTDAQHLGYSALGLAGCVFAISAVVAGHVYMEGKEFAEEVKPGLLKWQVERTESMVEMHEGFLADAKKRFEVAKAEQEAKEAELEEMRQKASEGGVRVVSQSGYSISQMEYLVKQGRDWLNSGFFEDSIAHWEEPLEEERRKLERLRAKVK